MIFSTEKEKQCKTICGCLQAPEHQVSNQGLIRQDILGYLQLLMQQIKPCSNSTRHQSNMNSLLLNIFQVLVWPIFSVSLVLLQCPSSMLNEGISCLLETHVNVIYLLKFDIYISKIREADTFINPFRPDPGRREKIN